MTEHEKSNDVAVLGLGAMGTALADALLASGRRVTVWNRTTSRAEAVAARGAHVAPSAREALAAAPVVLVCLLDHAAVATILGDAGPGDGRLLVDLTTTSPAEARATDGLAVERGFTFVDGAIMAVPAMIGSPDATVYLSGGEAATDLAVAALDPVGAPRVVGAEAGLASLRDAAMLSSMYVAIAGLHQAVAIAGTGGWSAADFLPDVVGFTGAMVADATRHARALDAGDHTEVEQDLFFTRSAVDLIVRSAREQGVEPTVLATVQTLLAGEVDRGHAGLDTSALIEAFRRTS